MHPNAIHKIERHIKGSLINCYIKDSWPQYESFDKHVRSLGEEVIKHKKEWINSTDIFSIFYDLVYEAIKDKADGDEKLEGNLWDVLGDEKGSILTEHIKNYMISIPRTYDIYIPIPNILENLPESIELSKNISLLTFKDGAQIPGGYQGGFLSSFNELQLNKIYFRQRLTGYCGKKLENICLKRAISNLKILIQQAIFRNLFKISPTKAGVSALGLLTHYQVQKVNITSVDLTSGPPKRINVELPLDFSILLNNISFDWGNELLLKAKENGKIERAISGIMKKAIELIECEEEESKRVKSAIEWCFDSYVAENKTLAFLQICIGLEAILGDDSYNAPLTEILADRCAYLIGNDIKGRKTIKNNFKELYSVRSKLIHGNALGLDNNQEWYLKWGRAILEVAILKEIKHLNLGKK